jgi:hypothetical protein
MSGRSQKPEDNQKYRENCGDILGISPKIRYAGITNKFGRTLAGRLRQGVIPLLKPDEARNEYFIEATRNELRRSFENSIGPTEYTITENGKVKILTVPGGNIFYYITLDKDTTPAEVSKIVDSVRKLVRQTG